MPDMSEPMPADWYLREANEVVERAEWPHSTSGGEVPEGSALAWVAALAQLSQARALVDIAEHLDVIRGIVTQHNPSATPVALYEIVRQLGGYGSVPPGQRVVDWQADQRREYQAEMVRDPEGTTRRRAAEADEFVSRLKGSLS